MLNYGAGQCRPVLLRALGRRYLAAASTEEYAKRNYASNVSEYNTVLNSLNAQRRHFLLRDVYDDMMLDGVQPDQDTFKSLILGTMKGSSLQDAFYFADQMKTMGLAPDVCHFFFSFFFFRFSSLESINIFISFYGEMQVWVLISLCFITIFLKKIIG